LDTAADISIFRAGPLRKNRSIKNNSNCRISGITSGVIESIGTTKLNLKFDNRFLDHDFQVVSDSFPINTNGLLGKDFINKYKCIINLEDKLFTVNMRDGQIKIDIVSEIDYIIPSRCRAIRKLNTYRN
jgi:hypothetical protein